MEWEGLYEAEQFLFCWSIQKVAQNLVWREGGVGKLIAFAHKSREDFVVKTWFAGKRQKRGASVAWHGALDLREKIVWEIPSLGTGY